MHSNGRTHFSIGDVPVLPGQFSLGRRTHPKSTDCRGYPIVLNLNVRPLPFGYFYSVIRVVRAITRTLNKIGPIIVLVVALEFAADKRELAALYQKRLQEGTLKTGKVASQVSEMGKCGNYKCYVQLFFARLLVRLSLTMQCSCLSTHSRCHCNGVSYTIISIQFITNEFSEFVCTYIQLFTYNKLF